MRAVNLAKIAVKAEILRIQHMLKRQGLRAAFGLVAILFALGVFVLAHVAGWQALRLCTCCRFMRPSSYSALISWLQ